MERGIVPAAGYERPRPAGSKYTADQFEHYGLPRAPTMGEIEPVALELLDGEFGSSIVGAELVLGRHIPDDELTYEKFNLGLLLSMPGLAEAKIELLFILGASEEKAAEEQRVRIEQSTNSTPVRTAIRKLGKTLVSKLTS